jgi:hypothetical protein
MMIDAAGINDRHGMPLAPYDKAICITRLRALGADDATIQRTLTLTEKSYDSIVRRKLALHKGQPVAIKRTLQHMAGQKLINSSTWWSTTSWIGRTSRWSRNYGGWRRCWRKSCVGRRNDIVSGQVLSCPVQSRLVLSSAASGRVSSGRVSSRLVQSSLVECRVLSSLVLSCRVRS